jgi:methyltransferase (TIGR00027 family)
MKKSSSIIRSALGPASIRAFELYHPNRLFEDRYALDFLPLFWRVILEIMRLPILGTTILALRERQFPGVMGNLLCRTRFIDDMLSVALKEGLDQVVILGAGFDSRAYRIPNINGTQVFEVDHPATQARKEERLQQILGNIPPHVTFVPIDFDKEKLEDVMTTAGFQTGAKTFFIWEGVTQYITAEAVDATFRYISRFAAPGSGIVFTYIKQGIVEGSDRSEVDQKVVTFAERLGMPWIFGIEPAQIDQFLAERGLELIEHVGASDYRARYLDLMGRQINIFEGERVVLARIITSNQ